MSVNTYTPNNIGRLKLSQKNTYNRYIIFFILTIGFIQPTGSAWGFYSYDISSHSVISLSITQAGHGKPKPRQEKKNKKKQTTIHRKHVIEQIRRSRWERESFETTKRQILESRASDRAKYKYLKDGLIAHEGHARQSGGHTIERHVGLSNKGLRDRYAHDRSLIKRDGTKTPEISTFHSLKKAEHFIERTIQEKMKTKKDQKEMKDFLKQQNGVLVWSKSFGSETTGSSLHGVSGQISNVNGVRVVLKRDANHRNGWKVLTAYPEKG